MMASNSTGCFSLRSCAVVSAGRDTKGKQVDIGWYSANRASELPIFAMYATKSPFARRSRSPPGSRRLAEGAAVPVAPKLCILAMYCRKSLL